MKAGNQGEIFHVSISLISGCLVLKVCIIFSNGVLTLSYSGHKSNGSSLYDFVSLQDPVDQQLQGGISPLRN